MIRSAGDQEKSTMTKSTGCGRLVQEKGTELSAINSVIDLGPVQAGLKTPLGYFRDGVYKNKKRGGDWGGWGRGSLQRDDGVDDDDNWKHRTEIQDIVFDGCLKGIKVRVRVQDRLRGT